MPELSIEQWVFLGTAVFALSIILFYYLFFFIKLSFHQPTISTVAAPVSVIIAARNERHNLERYLTSILEQEYPVFEVVVVNDTSFDGTKDLLKEMAIRYADLKIVTVELDERFEKGKKFALTMGIKAAKHEHLLFTDADCWPSSAHWIQEMMNAKGDKEIVLGNAPLKTKRSPLGSIIAYETFHTALQYFTYSLRERTYMGVGRNLGYTKEVFFRHKGFASHQHIMSGDDDLFIQEAASKDNVSICYHSDAMMFSEAPSSVGKWIRQKRRHLSTSKHYQGRFKRLLGIYSLSQLLFYIATITYMAIFITTWYYAAIIIGFKWLVQWIVMFKPARLLHANKVRYILPYYDMSYTFYLILFGFVRQLSKPKKWK